LPDKPIFILPVKGGGQYSRRSDSSIPETPQQNPQPLQFTASC